MGGRRDSRRRRRRRADRRRRRARNQDQYEKLAITSSTRTPRPRATMPSPPQRADTWAMRTRLSHEAEVTVEGFYGLTPITHCCLESHGSVNEWEGDKNLLVHISTQAVSGVAAQMAGPLEIPAANIRVKQDHIGGGFGSKFGPDRWDITGARLSKKAGGKPVKIMLERDAELMVAGTRPSAYARVKIGAKKDGRIVAWQSESWASGGLGGGGSPPIPYVFVIPNQKKAAHGHCHERRQRKGLARARASASLFDNDGRARRPGRETEHGPVRLLLEEHRPDRRARRCLSRRDEDRCGPDRLEAEVAPARR